MRRANRRSDWGARKEKNCEREKRKNIGSWLLRGELSTFTLIAIEIFRHDDTAPHAPTELNCCCTKHYVEVEKGTKSEEIFIPIFISAFFVFAFFSLGL